MYRSFTTLCFWHVLITGFEREISYMSIVIIGVPKANHEYRSLLGVYDPGKGKKVNSEDLTLVRKGEACKPIRPCLNGHFP